MTERNIPRLCFIGFGEAGQAFASGLPIEAATTQDMKKMLTAVSDVLAREGSRH